MTTNREWLYSLDVADLSDWFDAEHVDGVEIRGELDEIEHDSRKKLEADVRKRYTHTVSTAMWPPSANKHTDMVSVSIDTVLGWLDRQAAITANETGHDNPYVGLVRGKQWERTEISDYYCGRCGWKVTDHDSYCPECGGALHKASNKPNSQFGVLKTAENAENVTSKNEIHNFDDSREQLEADVLDYQGAWPLTDSTPIDVTWGIVRGWLDRQEAITERECIGDAGKASLMGVVAHERECYDKRIAELTAERDALADDLLTCNREREEYRELLSKAVTQAAEIVNLQP